VALVHRLGGEEKLGAVLERHFCSRGEKVICVIFGIDIVKMRPVKWVLEYFCLRRKKKASDQ
jgi:hypothetical protein